MAQSELKKRPIFDRSLGTAAGLSKLLPTGTTLAFQTMAPSFTRGGTCEDHYVNFAFTLGLIVFLALLTAALNFTDSVHGKDGSTHYGVVTSKGLRLLSHERELVDESKQVSRAALRKLKLTPQDVLHAVVSAAVFLALAFCDAGVQRCLVNNESKHQLADFFTNLPLAVGFLATFLFIAFPSTRKGIGNGEDGPWGGTSSGSTPPAGHANEKKKEPEKIKATNLLAAAATLSKLLPMGTTLAFQTMAPSFTNGGECDGRPVNLAFTWGLIVVLTFLCAALSFTDSVTDPDPADGGHTTYYGLATCRGFWFFNDYPKHLRENKTAWENLQKEKKIRERDFLHAVVSAAVFVALAFCDAGVQRCLGMEKKSNLTEFFTLLPLAVAFLASFLFVVFPSDRKGIGEEGTAFWHHLEEQEPKPKQPAATDPKGKAETESSPQAMAAMSISRAAPSSEGHDGLYQPNSTPPPTAV